MFMSLLIFLIVFKIFLIKLRKDNLLLLSSFKISISGFNKIMDVINNVNEIMKAEIKDIIT